MKNIIYLISIVIFFSLNSCANGQSNKSTTKLNAIEFSQAINEEKDAQLIDVRTAEEFSKGHLKNALNIDWNDSDFEKTVQKLDKNKKVFLYCLSGGRSSSAAEQLKELGFSNVIHLDGGIMKWRAANLPENTDLSIASEGLNKTKYNELIKSEKIVLVDFYADWCGPCQKMKPYLEEIAKEMSKDVVVIRINADDNQELCKELNVDALPNLRIYKNQIELWNQTGFVEKEIVVEKLETLK